MMLTPFDAYRLVFSNGHLLGGLSTLPAGIAVCSLSETLESESSWLEPLLCSTEEGPFGALNSSLLSAGAIVRFPRGVRLDKPVHLLFISGSDAPAATHPRVVVIAEPGSSAAVIEEYAGRGGPFFSNVVVQVHLAEDASLEHTTLLREPTSFFHVRELRARVGRNARLKAHAICLGGQLVRCDAAVKLEAEGADVELNGLYLAAGRQHFDFHTRVDHAKPHGSSRGLYKGVLDGHARAVFNGLVEVRPDAQKSEAVVYNKNLLLSEHGLVNTKPEFKIHANDVQCKHGATIGQLNADALFYLRSRGIGPAQARSLLVYAFASEMLGRLSLEPMREALSARIQKIAGMEQS